MDEKSLYDRLGGEDGLRSIVKRFYGVMDELPEAAGIRKMHPTDLSASAEKLFMFLSGFLETALNELVSSEALRETLMNYFTRTAEHMRNVDV